MVGDVLGDDILQLSLLLGIFGDESGGLLLRDNEGEWQLSVEFVGDADDTDIRNERIFKQVDFHLCRSDLETADLQHLLETIDNEDFHVLVDRDLITSAYPTVDEGFLGGLLIVTVPRSHRVGFYNQLSRFVETSVGTIGPLDASDNARQENTSGYTGFITSAIGLHADHTSLGETIALKDGGLREESSELLESFIGERSGAAHDGAKTGEVELLNFGALAEHDNNRWNDEEIANLVFGDALKHTSEAEPGHDHY